MSGKEKKARFLDKIGLGKKERPASQIYPGHGTKLNTETHDADEHNHNSVPLAFNPADYDDMPENEIDARFEMLLDDMNLTDEKKEPLRQRDLQGKKTLLALHNARLSSAGSKLSTANDFIQAMSEHQLSYDKLPGILVNLRIALKNKPVSWVEEFGEKGLNLILQFMDRKYAKRDDGKDERGNKINLECARCFRAIMNNKAGLKQVCGNKKAIQALCKALDHRNPSVTIELLNLLAAICLVPPNGHDKVLGAITDVFTADGSMQRFMPIIKGLSKDNLSLIAACLQLINALVTTPDDLDFRLHLRNEFMRSGLRDELEKIEKIESEEVRVQYHVFQQHREEDFEEFSQRYDNIRLELEDVTDCYEVLKNSVMDTSSEPYFLSILQHLLYIREEPNIRVAYYQLIEECISQIVLHRGGCDPDFRPGKKFTIDVDPLIGQLSERVKEDEGRSSKAMNKKLEETIMAKQEFEAKVAQLETKLREYESGAIVPDINRPGGPPPPPMPGKGGPPPPPPPPMPGMGGGPPPPPGMGGPPPPPPMPGMGGPPPPPPMPGKGGPPPPPPPPGMGPPPPPGGPMRPAGPPPLPHGLKPKKKYAVDAPMKKANWKKINPQDLSEKAFWVHAKEEELPCDDVLKDLCSKFSTKPAGKIVSDGPTVTEKKAGKKVKELKVLDSKTAQNLSILFGSLKLTPANMKNYLLRCDEENLAESAVSQLIDMLPSPDIIKQLEPFKDQINDLADAEQFVVTLSGIKRLLPRLKSLQFKLRFNEIISDIKPDIVNATEACEEIRKSKKFAKILEIILLMGNYMNSGSNNAQSFGFEMSFITKLSGTKAIDNKTTLLHFLTLLIESKFPDVLAFGDELIHVEKAAKVSTEQLQKLVNDMGKSVKQLEMDLENNKTPQSDNDRFIEVMTPFAKEARNQYEILDKMLKKMESCFADLAEYFTFDLKKYMLDEFFTDITTFKHSFKEAINDNVKTRELEEKAKRAKEVREKAERERQKRQEHKNNLMKMDENDNEHGVMDHLVAAIQNGQAFSCNMNKPRKRAPRATGAARQAQLTRSRSRSGLPSTPLSPVALDIDMEPSLERDEDDIMSAKPRRGRKGNGEGRDRRPLPGFQMDGKDDFLEKLNAL